MKLKMGFLLLLWPFFRAMGQENMVARGLQPGDVVPEVALGRVGHLGTGRVHLSDFRGKLLILDFWATWCSPCVAMIPKMEALQRQYEGRLQFLPVAYQSAAAVGSFLQQLEGGRAFLPEVAGDTALSKLFPHVYLPHYVWIDGKGRVAAITEYGEVTAANIDLVLAGQHLSGVVKADYKIPYDREVPMLVDNNGGNGHNLLFHSLITGHTEGLHGGYLVTEADSVKGQKLTIRNLTLPDIFKIAWGGGETWFGANRMVIEAADKSALVYPAGVPEKAWYASHTWCYELVVPPYLNDSLYKLMQHDLSLFFNHYQVTVENRERLCLLLVRTSALDKLKTAGGESGSDFSALGCRLQNFPLDRLTSELDVVFMQKSPLPVIDDTGYTGFVDLSLEANLSDRAAVNRELARYDLELKEGLKSIPVLLIRDKP